MRPGEAVMVALAPSAALRGEPMSRPQQRSPTRHWGPSACFGCNPNMPACRRAAATLVCMTSFNPEPTAGCMYFKKPFSRGGGYSSQ